MGYRSNLRRAAAAMNQKPNRSKAVALAAAIQAATTTKELEKLHGDLMMLGGEVATAEYERIATLWDTRFTRIAKDEARMPDATLPTGWTDMGTTTYGKGPFKGYTLRLVHRANPETWGAHIWEGGAAGDPLLSITDTTAPQVAEAAEAWMRRNPLPKGGC